jgi:uncharacterized protein YeaO (DUF488 family)
MVKMKRIYEPALPDDGKRVFVDRLWPRGVKKTDCSIKGGIDHEKHSS